MDFLTSKLLSLEELLTQYRSNPRYELADRELLDGEPTSPHAAVAGKVASHLSLTLELKTLPWFIPRTCLIRPIPEIATGWALPQL